MATAKLGSIKGVDLLLKTSVDLATEVTNNLSVTHLNNGSGASATTFWCGDESWKAPSAGGVDLNAAPSSGAVSGVTISLTAGENLSFGDVCYFKSDGKVWKADANGSSTFPSLFMAAGSITANNTGSFLTLGTAKLDSWSWSVGALLYLSTTAGGITTTAPSATDDVRQVLGVSVSATIIFFRPSIDYLVHL